MSRSPLDAVVRHIRALAECKSGAALPDRHLLECFIHQRDEAAFSFGPILRQRMAPTT